LEYQVRETKDIPVRSFPQPFAPGVPAQILYSVAYPPPAVNRKTLQNPAAVQNPAAARGGHVRRAKAVISCFVIVRLADVGGLLLQAVDHVQLDFDDGDGLLVLFRVPVL